MKKANRNKGMQSRAIYILDINSLLGAECVSRLLIVRLDAPDVPRLAGVHELHQIQKRLAELEAQRRQPTGVVILGNKTRESRACAQEDIVIDHPNSEVKGDQDELKEDPTRDRFFLTLPYQRPPQILTHLQPYRQQAGGYKTSHHPTVPRTASCR